MIVAIFGPTASGKSAAAIDLAERIDGEIVSADAMQLYAGLPVLSNQPSASDRARVAHHLVGIWPATATGGVARYATLAHAAIDAILARGRVPIVAGGTGLYLRAALADLDLPPQPPPELRARIQAEYDHGPAAAYARLVTADADAAGRIHPNDRRRVVRALELHELGSSLAPVADDLWSGRSRHPTRIVGLVVPRPELHRRIEQRTDAMLAGGALDEVRAVYAAGPPSTTAARTLGLAEIRRHLDGATSLEAVRQRLIERTRSYARRQEVWMRKIPNIELVESGRVPTSG